MMSTLDFSIKSIREHAERICAKHPDAAVAGIAATIVQALSVVDRAPESAPSTGATANEDSSTPTETADAPQTPHASVVDLDAVRRARPKKR